MASIQPCPIWKGPHSATRRIDPQTGVISVSNSDRAGGGYIIDSTLEIGRMYSLELSEKARLTTWLIDQRAKGNEFPEITKQVIDDVVRRRPMQAHERAERLLQFIGSRTQTVGSPYDIRGEIEDGVYAWSESTTVEEIGFLIHYLVNRGWIDASERVGRRMIGAYDVPVVFSVTVDGYSHIGEQFASVDSSQAFVAMWMNDEMDEAYEEMNEAYNDGIALGIRDSGYKPFRIDKKEYIDRIDDHIIAEIKRSKFLVADFSHGDDGVRGSVYYEAGFAHGLNIPVIFVCRKGSALHFDTNHFNHIFWTGPEELRKRLRDRILHVIGEGPLPNLDE